jgi:hypothetical protein
VRDFHLRFFQAQWPNKLLPLADKAGAKLLSGQNGCYVLGTQDGTDLVYPWGRSPVFYIGLAKDLEKRLAAHRKWVGRAEAEHFSRHFLPLHQYGASFGAVVAIYFPNDRERIETLESDLITHFYQFYGAISVANGAWPKDMRQPLGQKIT